MSEKVKETIVIQHIKTPDWSSGGVGRLESGVVRINEDWSGVFIRGDSAFGAASAFREFLKIVKKEAPQVLKNFYVPQFSWIFELFEDCDVRKHKDAIHKHQGDAR